MARNSLGREIPSQWRGRTLEPYLDPWSRKPEVLRATRPLVRRSPGDSKLLPSLRAALEKCELRDGMNISTHHHLRNGDVLLNRILDIPDSVVLLKASGGMGNFIRGGQSPEGTALAQLTPEVCLNAVGHWRVYHAGRNCVHGDALTANLNCHCTHEALYEAFASSVHGSSLAGLVCSHRGHEHNAAKALEEHRPQCGAREGHCTRNVNGNQLVDSGVVNRCKQGLLRDACTVDQGVHLVEPFHTIGD